MLHAHQTAFSSQNALAIAQLPDGMTSYDVWELLAQKGLEATIVVTAAEVARLPNSLHLEFSTPQDAQRAMSLLRAPSTKWDIDALAV